MTTKFEQLIEFIINDEEGKAKELFHSIVVEKSREIYEELDAEMQEGDGVSDDQVGEFVDAVEAEEMAPVAEAGEDEMPAEFGGEEGGEPAMGDEMGAEPAMGDELGGEEGGEFGGDAEAGEMGEADLEDRVVDLEDALDELKAEFDTLVGDEGAADELGGDEAGDEFGGEEGGEFGGEEGGEVAPEAGEEEPVAAESIVREYTEKAPTPVSSEEGGVNKKSPIISGKNDMGGTTANIAKGGGETTRPAPTAKDMGYKGPKEAAKGAFKSNAPKPKTGEESGVNKKSAV